MSLFTRLRNAAYGFFAEPEGEELGEFWMVDAEDPETGAPALIVYGDIGHKEFMFVEGKFAAIRIADQGPGGEVKSYALADAPPYLDEIPFGVEFEEL
jgi:hypothetical protein